METDLESGKDEYERIQDQLFLYTGSEVKKEEIEKEDNALGVNIAITGIMLILFFFIFFLIFDKRRKRRREDAQLHLRVLNIKSTKILWSILNKRFVKPYRF